MLQDSNACANGLFVGSSAKCIREKNFVQSLGIGTAPFMQVKSQEDFDPESFNVPSFEAELANGIFDLEKPVEFESVGNQIALQQDAPMNVKTSLAFGGLAWFGRSTRTKSADRRARRKIHRPGVSGRTWKVFNEAERLHLRCAVPNEATI